MGADAAALAGFCRHADRQRRTCSEGCENDASHVIFLFIIFFTADLILASVDEQFHPRLR